MSANDNAASTLDLIRAIDGAIDLIVTDFVCAISVGADGACVQATLRQPNSFDGMPIILRAGINAKINEVRLPQDGTAPAQELIGGGSSQLSLFSRSDAVPVIELPFITSFNPMRWQQ